MNKILIASCFVLAGGFAANAIAQDTAAQAGTSATTAATDQSADANGKAAVGTRAVPAPGDRNCLRDTGSLIPPPKGKCLPVAGRSYSQQDIQRTGQPDTGRALQQLDPSVQVSGH